MPRSPSASCARRGCSRRSRTPRLRDAHRRGPNERAPRGRAVALEAHAPRSPTGRPTGAELATPRPAIRVARDAKPSGNTRNTLYIHCKAIRGPCDTRYIRCKAIPEHPRYALHPLQSHPRVPRCALHPVQSRPRTPGIRFTSVARRSRGTPIPLCNRCKVVPRNRRRPIQPLQGASRVAPARDEPTRTIRENDDDLTSDRWLPNEARDDRGPSPRSAPPRQLRPLAPLEQRDRRQLRPLERSERVAAGVSSHAVCAAGTGGVTRTSMKPVTDPHHRRRVVGALAPDALGCLKQALGA